MKVLENKKPENISIFTPRISPNKVLVDYRIIQRYGGLNFGTIGQLASNLGISMKKVENGLVFTAPKARLQMFVEKLHFSLINFTQI